MFYFEFEIFDQEMKSTGAWQYGFCLSQNPSRSAQLYTHIPLLLKGQ